MRKWALWGKQFSHNLPLVPRPLVNRKWLSRSELAIRWSDSKGGGGPPSDLDNISKCFLFTETYGGFWNFQVKFGQWKYAVKAVTGLWLIGGSLILAPLIFTALGRPARWLTRKRSEISKLGILSPACQWGSVRASSNLAQIIWDGLVAWKEIFAIMENEGRQFFFLTISND